MSKRSADQRVICNICGKDLKDQKRLLCDDCKENLRRFRHDEKEK
jgi:predicted amidophosphoribosyltransferase